MQARLSWLITGALSLAFLCCAVPEASAQERAQPAKRSAAARAKGQRPKRTRAKAERAAPETPAPEKAAEATPAPERAAAAQGAAPAAAEAGAEVKTEGDGTQVKVMEFSGLDIEGQLKTPQMLYFLNRLRAEFGRPRLPHRSFMPELQRGTQEKALR